MEENLKRNGILWVSGAKMEARVKKLYENIEGEKPEVIVLANATCPILDMTFFYATKLVTSGMFEGSFALLYPDGKMEVITSILEEESAKKGDFPVQAFRTQDERKALLIEKLKGFKSIGINAKELSHGQYLFLKELIPGSEFIDISKSVRMTRLIKDEEEIESLRKACQIASEAVEEIIPFLEIGVKEFEVAAELCYIMQKKGASGPSFSTIVAFEKKAAEPHYAAGDAILKKGDFILMDFGALYKRYGSDITRTFFAGKPTEKQRDIYETVRNAQKLAFDNIRTGVKGGDVHNLVSDFINSTEYKGKFTHGLGHSIGLAIHDGSGLTPAVDLTLEEGMVFTVEPGIYIPGYGGVRIEDNIVVRRDGPELLTTATREIIEV